MSRQQPAPPPRVGVAVFVTDTQGNIVLGRRKGSHGAGTYALPGGHLEHGETFEECAQREISEEIGFDLPVDRIRFLTATNDIMPEGKHYITIFMACLVSETSGRPEPELLEPKKCEGWAWTPWAEVREMAEDESRRHLLFMPVISLFEQRPGLNPIAEYETEFTGS